MPHQICIPSYGPGKACLYMELVTRKGNSPQVMTFLQSGMFSCSNILFETLFDRDVQSWTVKITKADIIS